MTSDGQKTQSLGRAISGKSKMDPGETELLTSAARLWQRILQVDHGSVFANSVDDIEDREHGFDRLPQPGFLGKNYKLGGVLLLGQNPGNDSVGKGMSASDQLQYRLLEELRDAESAGEAVTAFIDLMDALSIDVMPQWKIVRNVVQPLLDGLCMGLNQIAYTNLVKFRTNDSGFASSLYKKSWDLTSEQIDLLAPQIIVTLGVGTQKAFVKLYRGQARVYKVARGIGDSFLPVAGATDIARICAAERDQLAK